MVFFEMIDDRFIVRPGDLIPENALVTQTFAPSFLPSLVIPGVESFRLEAQVVDTGGRVRFVSEAPREVVIEVDLPDPAPIGIVVGSPTPPGFGPFAGSLSDTLGGLTGLGGFARDGVVLD